MFETIEVSAVKKELYIVAGIAMTLLFGVFRSEEKIVIDTTHTTSIVVKSGDTLWDIAASASSSEIDVRDVLYAMKEINRLDNQGELIPGTVIKVPTVRTVNPSNAADYTASQNRI